MDLVKIGFQINANGLKDANTEVDKLLDNVDNIGTKGKKASSDFESSQKKVTNSLGKTKRGTEDVLGAQNKQIDAYKKLLNLEQTRAKYISQGFGKTDATRISRMEISGADSSTLDNYKRAIEETNKAAQALRPSFEKVTESHNKFLDQVKGIAVYAALSAAIYGVMTAMTNLAVATVKMADEYTSIQNRMKLYITDAKELGKVNSQLAQFSMENNVGLRETATLFSRLAPSMQKLGANTAAITTVVDAFGKSMRIGGATAMEAASATIQFSQAMASGKLAGDEFRSISEASPRFLQAIAEGSGIAADKLKEMSAAGMLTTEVISKALLKEYPKLIEENKKLGVTMEQGANAIKTGFLVAIGEFNEGAGITKALGEAMLDLAQGMLTGAQNARQFGKDINDWFSSNAGTINTVVDAFKLLATVIATRYVASLVLATAASVKLTYQTSAMAAATTASMRAFVLGATAATAFGRAAQTAFAFMGGWAGIALTIAGVATSYLLLRDDAAEASKKLVESSEYADMTTNSFKQLNAEQQKTARASLIKSMSDVNEKLDEQANTVNRVLLSYVQLRQMQGKMNNKQLDDVINKTTKGLMDYDTAYRKLLELGAPTDVVEEFKKQKDVYNETAKSAKTLETSANAAGAGVKLAGNEAQNATPAINGLKDKTKQLGEEAVIAGSKFNKMAEDFKKAISDSKDTLNIMQKYDLDETSARKVVSSVRATFDPLEQKATDLTGKIKVMNKQLSGMGSATPQQRKLMQEHIDSSKEALKILQEQIKLGKDSQAASLVPYAKMAKAEEDRISALTASRNKIEKQNNKEADNERKRLDSIREGYQEQIAAVVRLNNFKAEGMPYDIAKIAAEKDYYEAYTNVEKAFELAEARKTLARIDAKGALENETLLLTKLLLLQEKGVGYELARTLAQAAFSDDQEGMLAAAQSMHNELVAQQYSLADQVKQQTLLNHYLAKGLTLEEATVKASFKRLENIQKAAGMKGLSDQQKKLKEDTLENQKQLKIKQTEAQVSQSLTNSEKQRVAYVNAQAGGYANLIKNMAIANKIASDPTLSPDQAKALVEAEELTNYEKELAELKRQTYIATLDESEAVKTLVGNYSTRDSVQIGALAKQQQLLEIAKELAEEAEKQRNNPIGDFSNVDFSAFGDFGNPFQSALDGMNELIRTTTEGGEIIKQLTEEINAAKIMGLDTADRELELGIRTEKQANDKKKATDKAITSGLALTKSLFKEESKGYKVVSGLEKAYQASKIAFALWEKKDAITMSLLKLKAYITDTLGFTTGAYAKIVAQEALNITMAQGAAASAAQAPPPVGFASAAAMIALMAGIGIAIGGGGSSGGKYVDTSNQGTGTVFGDSEAKSASIANSIDILSDNSDLMLPLTSAMLRSLKNIESSIGGLTNLVIRTGVGKDFNIAEGFKMNGIGSGISKTFSSFNDLTFGVADFLTLGLFSAVGDLLGGLFGTKTTVKASGLFGKNQKLGDILSKGFNLQEYVDVQIKKKVAGVTTSNKTKTKYTKADAELSKQFTLIFKGFYDTILSATDILGADMSVVQTNLENAVVSIGKINLKGLSGEEIQEKLEAVFGAAADSLAQQAFGGLEDFQTVGEGYYETLVKVASAVEEAAYYTDRLNVTAINYTDIINKQADDLAAEIIRQSYLAKEGISTVTGGMSDLVNGFSGTAEEITDFITTLEDLQEQLFMTGKSGDYLTSSMILGAGGLDSLASGLDAYFEMLSPAEQAAELTRRLTNEFAIFGKELPADVKAFRNLVSSIDITTEAGQKLYGQIIALAPEFNDLQDALDSANSEVNALVQSLRDLAEQARAARGETEQPRNLAYTRSQFEQASVLAMQGDIASAEKLLTLGKDLMDLSKTYSVSGSEYARDLALIQRAATVSADIQEQGLGTSISTTLTPSTGTGTTTPTIATTNSTMTTELQGMREELNASLFAIAKFVQNVDSRTERWDDGNRVMVGIQPENGDTPVPVVVTP